MNSNAMMMNGSLSSHHIYREYNSAIVTSQTVVILVAGYTPGDTGTADPGTWHSGVNIYDQLVSKGYTVGSVCYYGNSFYINFSNGYRYVNNNYFGSDNTPIQEIGSYLGYALESIFSDSSYNVDIVAHSMGGLITLYMLEHFDMKNVNLENVIFMGTPFDGSPFASIAQYIGLSGFAGYQAQEMECGSSFLNNLDCNAHVAVSNYPQTNWIVYAGTYNPWWGYIFFPFQNNDGVVSECSATYLGYTYLYTFNVVHASFLDPLTAGGVSYFQDQNVANTIIENLAGIYN
ncbi:esterase/lipase family protein [Caldiplasma sukawensis]